MKGLFFKNIDHTPNVTDAPGMYYNVTDDSIYMHDGSVAYSLYVGLHGIAGYEHIIELKECGQDVDIDRGASEDFILKLVSVVRDPNVVKDITKS